MRQFVEFSNPSGIVALWIPCLTRRSVGPCGNGVGAAELRHRADYHRRGVGTAVHLRPGRLRRSWPAGSSLSATPVAVMVPRAADHRIQVGGRRRTAFGGGRDRCGRGNSGLRDHLNLHPVVRRRGPRRGTDRHRSRHGGVRRRRTRADPSSSGPAGRRPGGRADRCHGGGCRHGRCRRLAHFARGNLGSRYLGGRRFRGVPRGPCRQDEFGSQGAFGRCLRRLGHGASWRQAEFAFVRGGGGYETGKRRRRHCPIAAR